MTTTNQLATQQKITWGILGILTLLMGFGGYITLSPDQIDHAYVCSTNEKVGFFDHLSSTAKTGYWVAEDGTNKTSTCLNGQWISLQTYAKQKGVDVSKFLNPSNMAYPDVSETPNVPNISNVTYVPRASGGRQYRCYGCISDNCIPHCEEIIE